MQRPGFLMMDLLRALYWVDEGLQNGLRAHGRRNLSRSQSLVLLNIAFGVHRASVLATNIGISRQAISQMLAEMQKAKLIEHLSLAEQCGQLASVAIFFHPDDLTILQMDNETCIQRGTTPRPAGAGDHMLMDEPTVERTDSALFVAAVRHASGQRRQDGEQVGGAGRHPRGTAPKCRVGGVKRLQRCHVCRLDGVDEALREAREFVGHAAIWISGHATRFSAWRSCGPY